MKRLAFLIRKTMPRVNEVRARSVMQFGRRSFDCLDVRAQPPEQGQLREATSLYERSHTILQHVLGPQHRDVAALAKDTARTLAALVRAKEVLLMSSVIRVFSRGETGDNLGVAREDRLVRVALSSADATASDSRGGK